MVKAIWILFCAWAVGCSAPGLDDQVERMLDRKVLPEARVGAIQRLGPVADSGRARHYLDALHQIAWSKRHPDQVRCAAIDRLIEHDPLAFCRIADRWIIELDRWSVLDHIFDRAIEHRWRKFEAIAIRSYARPSQIYPDQVRPERKVLQTLHPDRLVEEVVFDVFTGLDPEVDMRHQVAAWTLLNRLLGPTVVKAQLLSAPPATLLVRDLQAATIVLDVLPSDREGILWLGYLQAGGGQGLWSKAARISRLLSPIQRCGLELRHLPILISLSDEQQARDRLKLIQRLSSRLASTTAVHRTEGTPLPSEALADHEPALAWADLATLDVLIDLCQDQTLSAQWFDQADHDRFDQNTEHGGVLSHDGARFQVMAFVPKLVAHDRKFYSSPELIKAMYSSVAHYHFHAQDHENSSFAGPGRGDLDFANRLHPTALVLTFIDYDTLNVDYYQAGDVVVDLGLIRR